MTPPVLKTQRLVARIIGLSAHGIVERSAPFAGEKTDEELIRAYQGIGRGVACLRIDRHAEVTCICAGRTQILETGVIGDSNYYFIQHDLAKKIADKFREVPAHEKYRGVLRILGKALPAPQRTVA